LVEEIPTVRSNNAKKERRRPNMGLEKCLGKEIEILNFFFEYGKILKHFRES